MIAITKDEFRTYTSGVVLFEQLHYYMDQKDKQAEKLDYTVGVYKQVDEYKLYFQFQFYFDSESLMIFMYGEWYKISSALNFGDNSPNFYDNHTFFLTK